MINGTPYYVYLYRDERGVPFYIGLGKGDRSMQHIKRAHWASEVKTNPHKVFKIRQMIASGTVPTVEVVQSGMTLEQAARMEIELIAKYGRRDTGAGSLTNLTDGGEGRLSFVVTDEYRKKMSEATSGIRNGRHGKPVSESTRLAIGNANRGKQRTEEQRAETRARNAKERNPFFGKIHSGETRQRIKEKRASQKMKCKTYEFIDPHGAIYVVTNGFDAFCKTHDLSRSKMARSIGAGVISSFSGNNMTTKQTINCIGWSVRLLKGGE